MRGLIRGASIAVVALLPLGTALAAPVPTWDRVVNGAGRFKVRSAMDSQAVLDKETGLVWERVLDQAASTYDTAAELCLRRAVGGRYGWRLPTAPELLSLYDPSGTSNRRLPDGHPFSHLLSGSVQSATNATYSTTGDATWGVNFTAQPPNFLTVSPKAFSAHPLVWCVRGPGDTGIDP